MYGAESYPALIKRASCNSCSTVIRIRNFAMRVPTFLAKGRDDRKVGYRKKRFVVILMIVEGSLIGHIRNTNIKEQSQKPERASFSPYPLYSILLSRSFKKQ